MTVASPAGARVFTSWLDIHPSITTNPAVSEAELEPDAPGHRIVFLPNGEDGASDAPCKRVAPQWDRPRRTCDRPCRTRQWAAPPRRADTSPRRWRCGWQRPHCRQATRREARYQAPPESDARRRQQESAGDQRAAKGRSQDRARCRRSALDAPRVLRGPVSLQLKASWLSADMCTHNTA
jgi:hypothetical protein